MASQENLEQDKLMGHNLGLGLLAVLAVIFGIWQIRNSIRLPFAPKIYNDDSQMTAANEAVLRASDTDGDGLSDYEEINFYRSSIYLKDTDSDGVDDKIEVDKGEDPNCPQGQDCLRFSAPVSQNDLTEDDSIALLDPQDIRKILKDNGATEEMLNKYSDQELINIYKQVAGDTGSAVQTGTLDTSLQLTEEEKSLLRGMSGSELRQFLISGGAKADDLVGLDDKALQDTVKQLFGL
ncbi:MAG: hypothetical protein ACOZAJ_00630 [Patescibacteria group bacterium]